VVGRLAPRLEWAEIERAKAKRTGSLDAYDCYLRGMERAYRYIDRDATAEALGLFRRAAELDPGFAAAYGLAARCYALRKVCGWAEDRALEAGEAVRLARRAAALGGDDAVALCTAGIALAYVAGDLAAGADLTERAVELNPNLAWGWLFGGWVKAFEGLPEAALERQARALRLSPLDPARYNMLTGAALAHLLAGRTEEASAWAGRALRDAPNYLLAAGVAAAANALAGRGEEARRAMLELRRIDPALRVASVADRFPLRRPEDLAVLIEGLRAAGLPR
jgi:tetratricopeptide (TPR) repeat protein